MDQTLLGSRDGGKQERLKDIPTSCLFAHIYKVRRDVIWEDFVFELSTREYKYV
jgi:hypothetical protein